MRIVIKSVVIHFLLLFLQMERIVAFVEWNGRE